MVQDRAELRTALSERIRQREIQLARLGVEAPPHVVTDLEQAQRDLAALDVVERPPVSHEVIAVVPPADRERFFMAAILDLTAQIAELKRLHEEDEARRELRQRETDEYRIRWEARMGNVRMALAVNAVATVLGWIFGRRG